MQTYEILVKNRAVRANSPDMRLVRTSVGVYQVHILFDDTEWLGFPVTATFVQGDAVVTLPLTLSDIDDSEWAAQSTVTIPREVMSAVGPIRLTMQGTDSDGNHIITAKGSPLTVIESGDTESGDAPSDAPTVNQWQQAYSDAMVLLNQVQGLADNLQSRLDDMVAQAREDATADPYVLPMASDSTLGGVMVGDGLSIRDGVLSAIQQQQETGLSDAEASVLFNLQLLATSAFDTSFGPNGLLQTAAVKASVLPLATQQSVGAVRPDGTTVTINDGVLSAHGMTHFWDGTTLYVGSDAGLSSANLVGPVGPVGPAGPQGPQGPSGYVLTSADVERISEEVYERYLADDETRY